MIKGKPLVYFQGQLNICDWIQKNHPEAVIGGDMSLLIQQVAVTKVWHEIEILTPYLFKIPVEEGQLFYKYHAVDVKTSKVGFYTITQFTKNADFETCEFLGMQYKCHPIMNIIHEKLELAFRGDLLELNNLHYMFTKESAQELLRASLLKGEY